jgi:hypothetical protein
MQLSGLLYIWNHSVRGGDIAHEEERDTLYRVEAMYEAHGISSMPTIFFMDLWSSKQDRSNSDYTTLYTNSNKPYEQIYPTITTVTNGH